MDSMLRIRHIAILAGLLGGAFALAACGGGDAARPLGARVTDPAAVPTSTPLQNALVYQIRGDVVSTTGGSGTVPAGSTPTPQRQNNTYTVLSGDTCADIATKFSISLDDLKKNNRSINAECSNLKIGDVIRIQSSATPTPTGPTPKTSSKDYKVLAGDNCGSIAAGYGVDVQKLIQLNGLDSACTTLKVGQILKIP